MGNKNTADATLELLGMNKNELREKVIEKAADRLLDGATGEDEDGYREDMLGKLMSKLREHTKERVDQTVRDLADEHILPDVSRYIENLTLKQTNKWGETRGKDFTFIEYLHDRAEAYLTEKVSYEGTSKGEDSYSWTGVQSRITYLVHEHLRHSISTAMKGAVTTVNDALAEGIAKTVKIQLAEITEKLQITVKSR